MWKFSNGKVLLLFFWTFYGTLLFDERLLLRVLAQQHPNAVAFGPPGVIGLPPSPQQPCDRTRRVFTDTYGEISDGPAGYNYTQDSHCEWLIKAQNDSQFITLTFRSMGTECSYDYVFVYDGDSFKDPLLGSFSGKTEPQKVVATSGSMLILLYSDTNYVLEGFKAEFRVSNCPNNCSDQGKCVGHQCVCHGDWIGRDCSLHACPDSCGVTEGRGKCLKEHCRCKNGFSGKSCSLYSVDPPGNEWHWMSTFQGGLSPRAAHTAVYVTETDALYIFGGYDLNNVLGSLQIYRFNKSTWEDEWGISLRSRHFPNEIDNALIKAVLHQNTDDEARRWGLKNDASFFRNILLTISDQKFVPRIQRSTPALTHNETFAEPVHDLTDFLEEFTDKPRPANRYGHAVVDVKGGFVIFGGKLGDVEDGVGGLSDELWFFNVTQNEGSGQWEKRAVNSSISPPALTRHSLTNADGDLYVFGGSLKSGEFSAKIYKIRLSSAFTEQWHEVNPRGGKALDVRVVAHTTVFHRPSNSLIVYGGVVAGVARFSKLSDRMFAFQLNNYHWTEVQYPRTPIRDAYIPRERAFHTATVIGNYMLIFGGYSHRHNKEEICYDNQMYLYHLGCHTWINQDVLGTSNKSTYPKRQGVFAHAATVRNGNTLLIVGGYHGNVNADLLAYTLPEMLVVKNESTFDPEAVCPKHAGVSECLSDPECGWCSADNVCYGRTIGANCTTNLQTTRCPGICPALGDCHACLIHGMSSQRSMPAHSVANKFGLNQCTWCVQNARCHHRDDNYGVCGEDTPSQEPGWWGAKGTEVLDAMQCTRQDHRPGLTFLKYLAPANWTQPDEVSVVNATMVDFASVASTTHTEQHVNASIVARLLGFIRSPNAWRKSENLELMHACASYSRATLSLGTTLPTINITAEQTRCVRIDWPQINPERFAVDFQARRIWESGIGHYQHSKMGLQHNGTHEVARAFTFEYLEPYSNGTCDQYANCAHCLSDSMCGWCELTHKCASRDQDEMVSCSTEEYWQYLVIQPSKCANCSNYISCGSCLESGLCEWWAEDARCARLGRSSNAVREESLCPAPCPERPTCSACLEERGRCVWCAATLQCFSFSVYTSEFQFGLCREWLDQAVPFAGASDIINTSPGDEITKQQQCKSCAAHSNCSVCLQSLSCGWCFDRDNPIEGLCMEGDFNRSRSDCAAALNATSSDEAEWAYAQCPDVDECGLGLHDCHREAKCTNTHGSYNCHCRRGFVGDGRTACVRTCYDQCINGACSGTPDYVCRCDLGWTGPDCSVNCGCNNHSRCDTQVGVCDNCQDWTEGDHCERCRPGSFGNATSSEGCKPCKCNGHGNQELGICDVQSGECYCQDNTEGFNCEMCNRNFYGDPTDGGQCYFQCEARGMLKDIGRQGIGSHQSHKHHWGPEANECLWIVSPHSKNGSILTESMIQLQINPKDLNVTCGENAVYVYDGLPDLIGNTQQSQLLAVFCSADTNPMAVEARSGHLTVHYKQGSEGQGFNATFTVHSCLDYTCLPPHTCNEHNHCHCADGFAGPLCQFEACPNNCSASVSQGQCDTSYGRCICSSGFGSLDCSQPTPDDHLIVTELFNAHALSESFEHLRKTLPRFGHSLVADKRGSLWMFGGYSLSHGSLNDIRQFDTKNNTWTQVTVDSTPDAKMPQGRYFHAADILSSRQVIYVFGGLSEAGNVLGDFWQFTLSNQRWEEVSLDDSNPTTFTTPPPLAGTTMTLIRDLDQQERLLLIGGFAPHVGLNGQMYEFDFVQRKWTVVTSTGSGPVGIFGHSAVFHQQSQVLYVYGGCEFAYGHTTKMSNRLFAFDYAKQSWSLLPTFGDMEVPRARFLHAAVATDRYMLVLGGRTDPMNTTDVLSAYAFDCNQWIHLIDDVRVVGHLPIAAYAQSMTMDPETSSVYVVGGWDGSSSQSRVTRIRIPADLCQLFSEDKYVCRQVMGCSFCLKHPANESHCVSQDRIQELCEHRSVSGLRDTAMFMNKGPQCNSDWFKSRNCSSFSGCASCLASWPSHPESEPTCKWCEKCSIGRCVPSSEECVVVAKGCDFFADISTINNREQCLESSSAECLASDCASCTTRSGCAWTNFQNRWMCVSRTIIDAHSLNITMCQDRCESHTDCHTCLKSLSMEGGYDSCRWSTQLNQCMSPSYQPMFCTGGVCGLVLSPSQEERCPEPCNAYSQCATCLRHAHCGWCSRNDGNVTGAGDGVCTEGSLESPAEHPAASTCDIIYASRYNLSTVSPSEEFLWNYVKCPPENECENLHHNCDSKSQRCVDLDAGYACECGDGYRLDGSEHCVPVCSQGCVRGQCVEPNQCHCDFGYVGANCSIQCQCNGHSNCRGPDRLDECIMCENNTIGSQCDKCRPLFVGDPRDNGECVPCIDYCNGHSDVCVNRDTDASIRLLSRTELENILDEGPASDAICLRCANQTADDRCEGCVTGHFRGTEDLRSTCRSCQCHGHGDSCDPVTGEKCNCSNNTESDATCSASSSRNSAQQCWMVQCSKCRDSYAGNPTEGHQCYKQITVESKMCFDAKTIDECKKPSPLRPGQTVFFVVQPRFMNVDIRIIVDVTQGELDLYMSPQDDSFVVHTNQSTGQHRIYLDNRYSWFPASDIEDDLLEPIELNPFRVAATAALDNITMSGIGSASDERYAMPSLSDCHTVAPNGFSVYDRRASALSTYVTLRHCNTLLRVYGLKNRMVLTLPQSAHNLSTTRFFIALKAANGPASYGLVFFRQDQLHIDLFVFFSVFFSCFFLFLAVCVVAWKAKQAADVRRARRRHVVEMLHMAKRPFSTVTLLIGAGLDITPAQLRRRGRGHLSGGSSSKHISATGSSNQSVSIAAVRPVAIEPTADGLAAVGTVFISLPGKSHGPVSLALGSALTTLARHSSIHSRTFMRRRGSHVQQQPPLANVPIVVADAPPPVVYLHNY